ITVFLLLVSLPFSVGSRRARERPGALAAPAAARGAVPGRGRPAAPAAPAALARRLGARTRPAAQLGPRQRAGGDGGPRRPGRPRCAQSPLRPPPQGPAQAAVRGLERAAHAARG